EHTSYSQAILVHSIWLLRTFAVPAQDDQPARAHTPNHRAQERRVQPTQAVVQTGEPSCNEGWPHHTVVDPARHLPPNHDIGRAILEWVARPSHVVAHDRECPCSSRCSLLSRSLSL